MILEVRILEVRILEVRILEVNPVVNSLNSVSSDGSWTQTTSESFEVFAGERTSLGLNGVQVRRTTKKAIWISFWKWFKKINLGAK